MNSKQGNIQQNYLDTTANAWWLLSHDTRQVMYKNFTDLHRQIIILRETKYWRGEI